MQETLFYIEPQLKRIPLSEFIDPIVGPGPNPKQTDSFKKGIVYPIILEGDGPYSDGYGNISDGRKRIKFCRKNSIKDIAALIYPKGYGKPSILNLTLNLQHKANLPSELKSIEDLVNSGKTEEQIAKDTNLPLATIKKLSLIIFLPLELREGVMKGKIKKTVAEKIAKLSKKNQSILVDKYKAQGNLTLKDVDEVRRVSNQENTDSIQLPFEEKDDFWRDNLVANLSSLSSQMMSYRPKEDEMPEFVSVYNILAQFTSDINRGAYNPTATRLHLDFDEETNELIEPKFDEENEDLPL